MEKIINISGKNIPLRASAATTKRYKMQFQRDFLGDMLKVAKLAKSIGNEFDIEKATEEDIKKLDFDIFSDIVWVFAKTANPSIAEPLSWLDQFDEFPIEDIIPEILDLISICLHRSKKN